MSLFSRLGCTVRLFGLRDSSDGCLAPVTTGTAPCARLMHGKLIPAEGVMNEWGTNVFIADLFSHTAADCLAAARLP